MSEFNKKLNSDNTEPAISEISKDLLNPYFEDILNYSHDLLWIVKDEKIVYASDRMYILSGYSSTQLKAMHILEIIHSEDRAAAINYLRSGIQGHELNNKCRVKIVCADSSVIHTEIRLKKIIWEDTDSLLVILRDVSDCENTACENRTFRSAADHLEEGILLTDKTGCIKYVNSSFENITGFSSQDITEKNIKTLAWDIYDKDLYHEIFDKLPELNLWKGKITIKRSDGMLANLNLTSIAVSDNNGNKSSFVYILRDVSKETELEFRLAQSQKMEAIGTLAGGIAHDFNNILNSILGFSELALEKIGQRDKAENFLREVINAGKRAKELVSNILTFSRKTEQEKRPMLLQPVVKETLKLLKRSFPSTIEIRTNIDPECSPVIANVTHVQQVIMNLCTNALHAMREHGGKLKVDLRNINVEKGLVRQNPDLSVGNYVCLSVEDTGAGIDQSIMKRIFEPYFTTKKLGEGTGLGLATVLGIVKDHSGAVMVESTLNKGSVFDVYFPAYEKEIGELQQESDPSTLQRGSGHILLIDDQEPIIHYGKISLEDIGYEVTACSGSLEALELFKSAPERFDLILTDQTMPKMTGIDLAEEMLRIRKDIPIILCSGYTETVNEEIALKKGIKKFLKKPIERAILAAAIKEAMK